MVKVDEYDFIYVKNNNYLETDGSNDVTWSIILVIESHGHFKIGGQMSGERVEPYHENGLQVPKQGEVDDEMDIIEWAEKTLVVS